MVVNLVAAVPIEAITVAGKPAIIVAGSDKLDQPFKTAERRGRVGVEIEEAVFSSGAYTTTRNCCRVALATSWQATCSLGSAFE